MSESFADKLAFVQKVHTRSRSRLAAELGVDKSVVGRWASGEVRPSAHNLSRLTSLVASRVSGFKTLDWDLDGRDFAALFGVDRAGRPAVPEFSLSGGLPFALLPQAIANTAQHGGAYEGFYRSIRPLASRPGQFAHDYCMVRKDDCGLLRMNQTTGGVFVDGWVLPLKGYAFVVAVEFTTSSMVFAMLHTLEDQRIDVLDGLILSLAFDAGRTPTATPVVFERLEPLKGDRAADEARFAAMAGAQWLAPEGSISDAMRAHLTRDTGDSQLALGGDWMMRMPACRSLARAAARD